MFLTSIIIPHFLRKIYILLLIKSVFIKVYASFCCAKVEFTIDPKGKIKKCGEFLSDPNAEIGLLSKDGDLILKKNRFSHWVKIKDRTTNERCAACKMKAACFNGHCPKKVNSGELDCCCGDEHTYIDKVMDLLTSSDYEFINKY